MTILANILSRFISFHTRAFNQVIRERSVEFVIQYDRELKMEVKLRKKII
jgi:hypothetical protein